MVAQNTFAEIFKILLGVALNAHKIDGVFIFYKATDQRRFADTAAAIDYNNSNLSDAYNLFSVASSRSLPINMDYIPLSETHCL